MFQTFVYTTICFQGPFYMYRYIVFTFFFIFKSTIHFIFVNNGSNSRYDIVQIYNFLISFQNKIQLEYASTEFQTSKFLKLVSIYGLHYHN